ncbi:MAG: Mpv17/PMP22 family protein [Marinilabiliales bacterium]|nr:Mpv17/PMP22 family protein [Marinilabiliales bacterium]
MPDVTADSCRPSTGIQCGAIVLKKTIPFFWIPAQTITFLLPPEFQILFAALLSTVLGVILACRSAKA